MAESSWSGLAMVASFVVGMPAIASMPPRSSGRSSRVRHERPTKTPAHCGAVAPVVVAAAAAVPAVANAANVRTVALKRGLTSVELEVRHKTGRSPPAILLSTASASLRCSVADYSYVNRERRARFQMRIRCPQARRSARATLGFREPFLRTFRLRNGVGTVRVEVDKPRGDALPLGRLTTRPAEDRLRGRAFARASRPSSLHGHGTRALPRPAGERERRPRRRRVDRCGPTGHRPERRVGVVLAAWVGDQLAVQGRRHVL
jgi:hypothetical protein